MSESKSSSIIRRTYEKLTSPETIKICGILIIPIFFGLFCLAVLVAIFLGPTGYNIVDNWISDMGSYNYTPAPFLLDAALIGTGVLMIPFTFYLENHIAPIPRKAEDLPAPHRWIYRLTSLAFFWNMIGNISMVLVGIFSEDRDINGLHYIFSYGAFGSLMFGAIFLGLAIIFAKQTIVPTPYNYILGIYGIFVPLTVSIFTVMNETPLMEWSVFFTLLGYMVPLLLLTFRYALNQSKNK